MLGRSRVSFSSGEVHTSQSHATIGTPALVPEPRKVILSGGQVTEQKYEQQSWNQIEMKWKIILLLPGISLILLYIIFLILQSVIQYRSLIGGSDQALY